MTALSIARPAEVATDEATALLRAGALLHRVRATAAAVWRLDPGRYLAIPDGNEVIVLRLGGLARIGRRPGADIVLDDATVTRRPLT